MILIRIIKILKQVYIYRGGGIITEAKVILRFTHAFRSPSLAVMERYEEALPSSF